MTSCCEGIISQLEPFLLEKDHIGSVFFSSQLRLDPNWEENPDKAILEWGGIHTSHARR